MVDIIPLPLEYCRGESSYKSSNFSVLALPSQVREVYARAAIVSIWCLAVVVLTSMNFCI
jgi:hypothetical protein